MVFIDFPCEARLIVICYAILDFWIVSGLRWKTAVIPFLGLEN